MAVDDGAGAGGGAGGGGDGGSDGAGTDGSAAPSGSGANGDGSNASGDGGQKSGDGKGQASGAGAPSGDGAEADGAKGGTWYDKMQWGDAALKEQLVKSGYHAGTAEQALEKALKGEMTATQKLGKSADQIMDRPGKDQALTDFFKANPETFGLASNVEDLALALPEGTPDEMAKDPDTQAMLGAYSEFAVEQGIPKSIAEANAGFYAKFMGDFQLKIETDKANAETALNDELKAKWGGDYAVRQQASIRAFQSLAAKAGMQSTAAKNVAQLMNAEVGNAGLLSLFSSLAESLGEEDLLVPAGGNAPSASLAAAEQRKGQIMGRDGEMNAAKHNDKERRKLQEELKGLNNIIATHKG